MLTESLPTVIQSPDRFSTFLSDVDQLMRGDARIQRANADSNYRQKEFPREYDGPDLARILELISRTANYLLDAQVRGCSGRNCYWLATQMYEQVAHLLNKEIQYHTKVEVRDHVQLKTHPVIAEGKFVLHSLLATRLEVSKALHGNDPFPITRTDGLTVEFGLPEGASPHEQALRRGFVSGLTLEDLERIDELESGPGTSAQAHRDWARGAVWRWLGLVGMAREYLAANGSVAGDGRGPIYNATLIAEEGGVERMAAGQMPIFGENRFYNTTQPHIGLSPAPRGKRISFDRRQDLPQQVIYAQAYVARQLEAFVASRLGTDGQIDSTGNAAFNDYPPRY